MSVKINDNWVNIIKTLENTLHSCSDMPIHEGILISSTTIYTLKDSMGVLTGYKVNWIKCPYCGISFYKTEKEEVK